MKEQDLIDLGFERVDEYTEEGDYHYYVYDFTKYFSLITCTDNEVEDDRWHVEFFDDNDVRFYSKDDVKTLIELIERNKI